MRKFTSLTALLSFILTIATSVILYIAPQGRIAYWADWTLWGLTKDQWGDLHINVGTLFLLALLLHTYYNWKPITAYLSRAKKVVFFTRECNAALIVVLVVCLGTFAKVPPFSSFLALSDSLKDQAARTYGEPPYGHAELTPLGQLAPKIGMTPEQVLAALAKAGYPASSEKTTLLELARRYNVSPQRLYKAVQPDTPTDGGLPETPPSGTGSLTLDELAAKHGLDAKAILTALAARGVTAQGDMTIKAIAEKNGKGPLDMYALIRQAAGTR
ncbi:MAG: DUF4405 domain-containing protein [Solidesulfovibrio sp.]